MKRLFLLAICLSFAALADIPMWQRNNGAWEAVVRVSKDELFWDFGDFRAVTNCVQTYYTSVTTTTTVWRVDYHREYTGNNNAHGVENWHVFTHDLDACTNHLASPPYFNFSCTVSFVEDRVKTVVTPHSRTVDVPCRFGVPASISVDLPYTDLLEMLPLDWPGTYINVRTGFDGYILIRLDENEMRLTIKRLLPEKLPYERTPQNLRLRRDDVLNGV